MPVCIICKKEMKDLSRHIKFEHQFTVNEYKQKYATIVVDPSVEEKRKNTCLEKYGNSNYKNDGARRLSYELFEGGHPLRDPHIRDKACKTKARLYGDPDYTNRGKAKKTCIEKYGVENVSQVKGILKKRVQTSISKYGRAINYVKPALFTKEKLIDLHIIKKLSLGEIAKNYNLTSNGVGYWMKKFGIPVKKKVILPWMNRIVH